MRGFNSHLMMSHLVEPSSSGTAITTKIPSQKKTQMWVMWLLRGG